MKHSEQRAQITDTEAYGANRLAFKASHNAYDTIGLMAACIHHFFFIFAMCSDVFPHRRFYPAG